VNHIIFSGPNQTLKVYDMRSHDLVWSCVARNDTVASGFGHYGACPPGDYQLGAPQPLSPPEVPYGFFYTPLLDVNGLWAAWGRAGIGVHGGGSGLPDPFADQQGWMMTEGCIRLQNDDNAHFIRICAAGDLFSVFQGAAT